MSRPVVIAVAITGSVPRKKDNPALPVTPAEQIESTHEAFEAGASLVHIHVRNPDESSSSDPKLFQQVQEGINKHCPGMIVQFSTGGRGRDQAARGSSLYLRPDMASLSTGSVNFPTIVYEIFDLSHIHAAKRLIDEGLMNNRPHVQFVMGVKNAMPADEHLLNILLAELKRVIPGATWTAAGIGRFQNEVMRWVLERGADGVRTGLEDNIRITKDRLAKSNAELVQVAVDLCAKYDARPATVAEARRLLGIRSA
jgi:3-keto-5-aminohexanoate cleavage enzyme